jgi:tripartite-type tricarboxylate transporter receptor subunit TctC
MRLTRRTVLHLAGSLTAAPALPPRPLRAQEWPARPIKIVVGTAAGGSPDIISRILGDKLGQSFVIENNSQGAGGVAQQLVAKSAPDGYT